MASSGWNEIMSELSKDVARDQPQDALQWGADWFQSKLKGERATNRGQATPTQKKGLGGIAIPSLNQGGPKSALSPFSETGPRDSPFSQQKAASSSNTGGGGLFSSSFGSGPAAPPTRELGPDDEDDGGPTSGARNGGGGGGGLFSSSSPFGQPTIPEDHHDEPPVPSYALGRRTSVSAESLKPQTHKSRVPAGLDSTLEEDENGEGGNDQGEPENQIPNFPKSKEQLDRIKAAISPNFLFRNLDEEQEKDVLAAMKEIQISAGEMIIEQGAAGDYFYVVEKGTLEVFVKKDGQVIDPEKGDKPLLGKKVATCVEGNSFGELALMHNAPRAASIISVTPCTLWALDRVSFRTILLDHTSRKRRLFETFLSEVPILASLQPQERAKIADVLESRTFNEGEDVIKEGEVGEEFFLIEQGNALAIKNQDGRETTVKQMTKGDYFGELALINRQTRAATIRAAGPEKLVVAALGEQAFTRLLGPVKDIMARNVGERYGFAAGR